jgi:hypothetical protein
MCLWLFQNSKIRIKEIQLMGSYQFKEASDAIRQQFGENKRLRFQNKAFRK